jgi:acyl-CoA reductase-like NAD-dependent aldehyde dehydrogenase
VTGTLLHEYDQHADEVIDGKIQLASENFREYRKLPFAGAHTVIRAVDILQNTQDDFARLMTQEMCKLPRAAIQAKMCFRVPLLCR